MCIINSLDDWFGVERAALSASCERTNDPFTLTHTHTYTTHKYTYSHTCAHLLTLCYEHRHINMHPSQPLPPILTVLAMFSS